MSYVRDNLLPNEKVFFSAHITPAIFLRAATSFAGTLVFFLWGLGTPRNQNAMGGVTAGLLLCTAGLFFLLTIVDLLRALIIMFTTEFAVTNRRVIAKRGLVRRHTLEMLLPKIESVAVKQGILGRLLDYGTVTVVGTGGTRESFPAIESPLGLRTKINQIIENYTQALAQVQQQKASNPVASD